MEGHTDGLICLTGAGEGAVTRLIAEGQQGAAERYLSTLETYFPNGSTSKSPGAGMRPRKAPKRP
jgi:DNA polymerase III alpha subunit